MVGNMTDLEQTGGHRTETKMDPGERRPGARPALVDQREPGAARMRSIDRADSLTPARPVKYNTGIRRSTVMKVLAGSVEQGSLQKHASSLLGRSVPLHRTSPSSNDQRFGLGRQLVARTDGLRDRRVIQKKEKRKGLGGFGEKT